MLREFNLSLVSKGLGLRECSFGGNYLIFSCSTTIPTPFVPVSEQGTPKDAGKKNKQTGHSLPGTSAELCGPLKGIILLQSRNLVCRAAGHFLFKCVK